MPQGLGVEVSGWGHVPDVRVEHPTQPRQALAPAQLGAASIYRVQEVEALHAQYLYCHPSKKRDQMTEVKFDTKIAVIVRSDLETWQALNVTAFMVGGIAGTQDVTGLPYEDGSGNEYLPMVKQPVLIFSADADSLRAAFERARTREVSLSIYTEELFTTYNDDDNRAAVRAVGVEDLNLVGIAIHGRKRQVDRVLKGLTLFGR